MIIFILLTLVDIHTLFILVFHNYLSIAYILTGSTFPIIKGILFYIPTRNFFSLIDIVIGVIMLFLLIGPLWNFVFWTLFLFLSYMILISIGGFIIN